MIHLQRLELAFHIRKENWFNCTFNHRTQFCSFWAISLIDLYVLQGFEVLSCALYNTTNCIVSFKAADGNIWKTIVTSNKCHVISAGVLNSYWSTIPYSVIMLRTIAVCCFKVVRCSTVVLYAKDKFFNSTTTEVNYLGELNILLYYLKRPSFGNI